MIINHNIPAMNTNRYLQNNNNSVSSSLEKLSSGLKINKAGDDAAGLAISEKMRAQIRGLDQATENAQTGVSLIQTAEGSLEQIEDILQRMRELADKSANDTNVNTNDREAIQLEIDALVSEIDRISEQSEFNTQALLDGSFSNKKFHIGANTNQNISVSIEAMSTDALKLNATYSTTGATYSTVSQATGYAVNATSGYSVSAVVGYAVSVGGVGSNVGGAAGIGFATQASANAAVASLATNKGYTATINDVSFTKTYDSQATAALNGACAAAAVASIAKAGGGNIATETLYSTSASYSTSAKADAAINALVAAGTINNTSQANIKTYDAIMAGTATNGAKVLDEGTTAIKSSTGGALSLSTQQKANLSIETLDNAINTVSMQRAQLGAIQNRLEYAIQNLETSSENTSSAESNIRDVNMAKEMTEYTKYNILSQSATAMLAQANQAPQGVLSLLG